MSSRNARLLYGDSRGSSNVVTVQALAGEDLEAGDLVTNTAMTGDFVVNKPSGASSLFGVVHEDAKDGELATVEVPVFAVYEVTLADASNFDNGGPTLGDILNVHDQAFGRTSTEDASAVLIDSNPAAGEKARVILVGLGISSAWGSILGQVPQI
ncbi:MAG: hypothetical protein ACLFVS_03120 [Candidatus Acetothermia bacterium]